MGILHREDAAGQYTSCFPVIGSKVVAGTTLLSLPFSCSQPVDHCHCLALGSTSPGVAALLIPGLKQRVRRPEQV